MPRKQAAPDDPVAEPYLLDSVIAMQDGMMRVNEPSPPVLTFVMSLTPDMIAAGAAIGEKYFHEFNPAKWWFDRLARETFEAMASAGGYVIKVAEAEGDE